MLEIYHPHLYTEKSWLPFIERNDPNKTFLAHTNNKVLLEWVKER